MEQGRLIMLDCLNTSLGATATVLLVTDAHDFDAAAGAQYVSDISADEASPTNYARQPLAYATGVSIDSDGRAVITWTETTFGTLGGAVDQAIGGAYVFGDTGDDATSPLIYRVPASPPETTTGAAFVIRWQSPTVFVA